VSVLLCLFLLCFQSTPVSADRFYKPGFSFKIKGGSAGQAVTDASQLGTFVFVKVGTSYISAVNGESGTERWRFTSKANAIRRMTNWGTFLLVEAEELFAIDPGTGQKKWEFPLNCHNASECNTRVRAVTSRAIVLSGFDKRNDHILVIDGQTGQRLWRGWLKVPDTKFLVYTPSTIVVASGEAPYEVIGLDRYTGRKRWTFRPPGTEKAASGLMAHGDYVTTWWEGRLTNEVYSIDLKTGKQKANWPVTKRARSQNDVIGGGPGFFYSYQPSYFGAGGTLKIWDTTTGDLVRRDRSKTILEPPTVWGNQLFTWTKEGSKTQLKVIGAIDGKEKWRYVRPNIQDRTMRFFGAQLVLKLQGKHTTIVVLNALTGAMKGVGNISGLKMKAGKFTYSDKRVFLMNGPRLLRLEPERAGSLLVRFDQFVAHGQLKEANALHKLIMPFIDEFPVAGKIHRRVVGQSYRSMSQRIQKGGFAALFPSLLRQCADGKMLYFEDFKAFMLHVEQQLKKSKLNRRMAKSDAKRAARFGARYTELLRRFQRKITQLTDKAFFKSNQSVIIMLSKLLNKSGRLKAAQQILVDLWKMPWCTHDEALAARIEYLVLPNVKRLLPAYAAAVARRKNCDAALLEIAEIPGLSLVIKHAPVPEDIPGMTQRDYSAHLARFRAAVKPSP